jgi:hypothetical protein
MADDLQYTVRFKTTSEGSGAKQVAKEIKEVGQEAVVASDKVTKANAKEQDSIERTIEAENRLAETRKKSKQSQDAAGPSESRGFGGQLDQPYPGSSTATETVRQEVADSKELIDTVDQRIKQERQLADVATARQRVAAKMVAAEAEAARAAIQRGAEFTVAGGVIAAVAKSAFDATMDLANAMAEADPQWAKDHAFALESLVALTNPIQTFWDTVTGGARQSVESLKASQAEVIRTGQQLEKLRAEEKARSDYASNRIVERAYQRELEEIDNQTAALSRQLKVLEAKKAAVEANAKLQDQIAISNGADPNAVAEAAARRAQAAQNGEANKSMIEAQQAYEAAKDREVALTAKLAQAIGGPTKIYDALVDQADKAANATEQAFQNLQATQQIAQQAQQEIASNTQSVLLKLGEQAVASNTEQIQGLAQDLIAKIGPQSGVAAQAKAGIEAILADGVQPEEIQSLLQQIQILAATNKQAITGGYQQTQSLIDIIKDYINRQADQQRQIDELKRQAANRGVGAP